MARFAGAGSFGIMRFQLLCSYAPFSTREVPMWGFTQCHYLLCNVEKQRAAMRRVSSRLIGIVVGTNSATADVGELVPLGSSISRSTPLAETFFVHLFLLMLDFITLFPGEFPFPLASNSATWELPLIIFFLPDLPTPPSLSPYIRFSFLRLGYRRLR